MKFIVQALLPLTIRVPGWIGVAAETGAPAPETSPPARARDRAIELRRIRRCIELLNQ